jgi:methylated-DNA-[protein]-cysteine S-methyltransferase
VDLKSHDPGARRVTMDMNTGKEITQMDAVETTLTEAPAVSEEEWQRVRGDLARRADGEGLVDVAYEMHDSPYGELLVGATAEGLVRVGLAAETEEEILRNLSLRISPRILRTERAPVTEARRQLDQYFAGERSEFRLDLDWRLTRGFRREVLAATALIPYGETRTYREMATTAGSPNAVRAAGTALATNPLPIVVPCHRVLRTDGKAGNYLGGTAMKESLLAREAALA